MEGNGKREMVEEVTLVGGLVCVQFVYAGNALLLSYVMGLGLNPYTLVIYTTFTTFLILSPFAAFFERTTWPKKLTLKFLIQLLFISLGGVTLFQSLFLKGIKLTSPAVATAMPNIAPGLIFLIAWAFRLEKVDLSCVYSKVKIIGTLLCVLGALTMSLMHSTPATATDAQTQLPLSSQSDIINVDKDKIVGCMYLFAAVSALSATIVLQASTLAEFPAPISLCAVTSFIGMLMTLALQFIEFHKIETGWPVLSLGSLIGYSLLGGLISGVCLSFNGWAMKKRGPVLVSMFSPIGTVVSVVLSIFTVGDTFNFGSLVGMSIMFTGLYFVLWAKGKESFPIPIQALFETQVDVEKQKPLLLA